MKPNPPTHTFPREEAYSFGKNKQHRQRSQAQKVSKEEEPLCILKVELDGGANVQLIKVYEGQLPEEIVNNFGAKFNLSERAKYRLLDQIKE